MRPIQTVMGSPHGATSRVRAAIVTCTLAVGLGVVTAAGGAQANAPRVPTAPASTTSDTIIVGFHRQATRAARAQLVHDLGHEQVDDLYLPKAGIRAALVEIPEGESAAAAIVRYERDPLVAYAEPNGIWHAAAMPSDPDLAKLWGLHNTGQEVNKTTGVAGADINAPEAWELTTGSPSVVVAVVDTGIQYDHPDLAPNMWHNPGESGAGKETNGLDDDGNGYVDDWRGWDWVDAQENVPGSGDNDPRDQQGHGTHVAGTIGANGNDGVGVVGVNWDVSLMPLRVLDAGGGGEFWMVAKAFAYAAQNGATVVNASLGGPDGPQIVADAIANAPNTLFVVAAGNDGENNDVSPSYPCSYPQANIVCVAASSASDQLAEFSNRGATSVDLAAPGTNIFSDYLSFDFQDEFDAGASQWTFAGTNNAWAWVPDSAGGHLEDSPGGNYANNTSSFATLGEAIDLSGSSGCVLSYFMHLDTQFENPAEVDFVRPEVSTNGVAWQPLHGGWAGSTQGFWVPIEESLEGFEGESSLRVRFFFSSDENETFDGVALDDVTVWCATGAGALPGHRFLDGTSMATPHVAGAAALLKAQRPAATAAQIKNALLQGVARKPAFAGQMVSGGRLDLLGSQQLLKTVPGAPASVAAASAGGSATVSWVPPAFDGGSPITGYVVTPFVGSTPLPPFVTGNVTQTLVGGLSYGETYTFTVRARNAVGDGVASAQSNPVKLVDAPGAPIDPRAVAGNARATVTWGAAPDRGSPVTGYSVTPFLGQVAQAPFDVGNVTRAVVTGLRNGSSYTFVIRARNGLGLGSQSMPTNPVTPRAPRAVASAAKLAPVRPRAGRPVTATVRVTLGGAPVRPARVACAGRIGKAKLKGKPSAARGVARCVYRPPRAAKGKRLTGSVSFTAVGTRFAKRFSARLR